jgi:hypothetical protein
MSGVTGPFAAGYAAAFRGVPIKVMFRFAPREDWLPFETEGLWATRLGPDTARIDDVPFVQDGVAQGDVFRFVTTADGVNWAVERVEASGNCTLRVVPLRDGPLGPNAGAVYEQFWVFGLGGETYNDDFPLVALNVPADASMSEIKALLARGEAEGWWSYEMGCSTDAWEQA